MTHEISHHELLQLLPANGCQAVFAEEQAGGTLKLVADNLDFLALARPFASHYQVKNGQRDFVEVQEMDTTIVGVCLFGGEVVVVNEAIGFAGLLMPGHDIDNCTHNLSHEYRTRLESQKKQGQP